MSLRSTFGKSVLVGAGLSLLVPSAHAFFFLEKLWSEADSKYINYFLGGFMPSTLKTERLYTTTTRYDSEYTEKDHYDSGLLGGFTFGVENDRRRYEFELMALRTTLNKIKTENAPSIIANLSTPNGTVDGTSGRITSITGFFNFVYDTPQYNDRYPVNAYIGLGVGPTYIQARTSVAGLGDVSNTGSDQVNKTNIELAGQFILGFAIQLDETSSMFIDYRYVTTTPFDFVGAVGVASNTFNGVASSKFTASTFQIGAVKYFDTMGNV